MIAAWPSCSWPTRAPRLPRPIQAGLLLLLLAAPLCECATGAKPGELVALEKLRAQHDPAAIRAADAQLAAEGEQAFEEATDAWKSGDLDESRHWALIGSFKIRAALILAEEAQIRARIETVTELLDQAQAEKQELQTQLKRMEEMIALYEDLAVAQTTTREKELHLSDVQQRAKAERKLANARIALHDAEIVEAKRHATGPFAAATDLIVRTEKLLAKEKFSDASAAAELARAKAREAQQIAGPLHEEEQRRIRRNQGLESDAAAMAARHRGVTVKLLATEEAPQLVLTIVFFFPLHQAKPHLKKRPILDEIAAMLKKQPHSSAIIAGYTSYLEPEDARQELSQQRADWITDYLEAQGLPRERLTSEGRSAKQLLGYRFSPLNDRLEVIIPLK